MVLQAAASRAWSASRSLEASPAWATHSGTSTAEVEFGQPGLLPASILEPDSGVTSKPFVAP
jgi:hypothetical protein